MRNIYKIERTVAPTDLVVSLAEAKTYLGVSHSSHDELITDIIKAATEIAETYTYVTLPQATFKMYLDDFYDVSIPKSPIIAISQIQYYNSAGIQTLPEARYELDLIGKPARIHWDNPPTVRDYEYNNVIITFTAGHTNVSSINAGIKQRIKTVINDMYDQRSSINATSVDFDLMKYSALFSPFAEKWYL